MGATTTRPRAAEADGADGGMPARSVPVNVTVEMRYGGAAATVSFTCLPEQVPDQMRQLKARGFRPRVSFDRTPDGQPICPRHGAVMRTREKQGDEWHSHKVTDRHGKEHYCRGYRGPDSPGYDVTPAAGATD